MNILHCKKTLEEIINYGVSQSWMTNDQADYIRRRVVEDSIFTLEQKDYLVREIVNHWRLFHRHTMRWLRIRKREYELGMRFLTPISATQLKKIEERLELTPYKEGASLSFGFYRAFQGE